MTCDWEKKGPGCHEACQIDIMPATEPHQATRSGTSITDRGRSRDSRSGIVSPLPAKNSSKGLQNAQGRETNKIRKNYDILILRLAIMFMLVILLGGGTALTFFLSNATCGRSLTQLVESYENDLLERTSDDILHLFNQGDLCGQVLVGMLQRINDPTLLNETARTRQSLSDTAIFRTFVDCAIMSGLGFTREDGGNTGFSLPDGATSTNSSTSLLWSFCNGTTPKGEVPPRYSTYVSKDTGQPLAPPEPAPRFDFRARGWYQDALSSPDGVAAQLLVGASGRPQLALARKVVLPSSGQVVGVVTLSFYLTAISDFMTGFDLKGGLMYVINGTMLLADTVDDYTAANHTTKYIIQASQSSNQIVRESFAYSSAQPPRAAGKSFRQVQLAGQAQFVAFKDFRYRNIELRQVLVLPRTSIMGSIDRGAKYTVAIVAGVAAAICALGFLLIVLFTNPVSKEMRLKAEVIHNLEAKRRAEAREEFKTKFLAKTSHDLRTPSAAMLGLLDMVLESELEAEQAARIQQVKDCALAQLTLLNDVLDFSKIEAGKMQLETVGFDIGAMLESLVDMFSVQCTAKGLEIALDMKGTVPRLVKGDSTRCRQIFTNLLSNAIKFTKDGYVLLRCYVLPQDERSNADSPHLEEVGLSEISRGHRPPGTAAHLPVGLPPPQAPPLRLYFEIDDTGCGIPPEKRDLVFQDYCQADASTSRHHGGTGLGLGIVRQLVEMMGGRIAIADKPGPGTLFRFHLHFDTDAPPPTCTTTALIPPALPAFPPPQPPGEPPPVVAGTNVVLGSNRFLSRSLSAASLRKQGATVVEVSSWQEALEALRSLAAFARGATATDGTDAPPPPAREVQREEGGREATLKSAASLRYGAGQALFGASPSEGQTSGENGMASLEYAQGGGSLDVARDGSQRGGAAAAPSVLGMGGRQGLQEGDGREGPRPLNCALLALSLLPGQVTVEELEKATEQVHEALRSAAFRPPGLVVEQPVAVAWVVSCTTPDSLRDVLKRGGFPTIVNKPLYESKLQRLLRTLAHPPHAEPSTSRSYLPPQSTSGPSSSRLWRCSSSEWEEEDFVPARSPPRTTARNSLEESGEDVFVAADNLIPLYGGPALREGDQILKGMQVLVAEDNPVLQMLSAKTVAKLGAQVVTANDGREAVDAVRQRAALTGQPFDLVLMDYQMPVMDGLAATRAIRQLEAATRERATIVMLTASAAAEDQKRCVEAGADLYVTKPIDARLLADKVGPLVQGRVKSGQAPRLGNP